MRKRTGNVRGGRNERIIRFADARHERIVFSSKTVWINEVSNLLALDAHFLAQAIVACYFDHDVAGTESTIQRHNTQERTINDQKRAMEFDWWYTLLFLFCGSLRNKCQRAISFSIERLPRASETGHMTRQSTNVVDSHYTA
jgi:hypothetical protein